MTLLHDYDVKMPNFMFYGMEDGNKLATEKFSFFQNSSAVPKKSTPVKFAYLKHIQWIAGINTTKFEKKKKTRIHFRSNVFAVVAVVYS